MERAVVERVDAAVYTVPTEAPEESDGTLRWASTTMVWVEVRAGDAHGVGYTYAPGATAALIRDTLADVVCGTAVSDPAAAWTAMVRAVRNAGRAGIAAGAISAIDTALWDLKARTLGIPLVELLGVVRDEVPLYGSGGFCSESIRDLQRQLASWAEQGFRGVKMKVGRDAGADVARVRSARQAIGPDVALMVDANGAHAPADALAAAHRFAEQDVTWFEEPVSSDDLEGLQAVRARAPAGMAIAAGEYGCDAIYFRRMLEAQAVDVLQADATRCLGITGLLHADALCQAHCRPLSLHTAPTLHLHVGMALPSLVHLEYFFDHQRIERMLFDGFVEPCRGALRPDRSRPGLGIELRRSEAERYAQ